MFAKRIGIDLGTSNTRVLVPKRGVVIDEPSIVALDITNNEVLAVGKEAEEMLGRAPESVQLHHPLRDGVIADFYATEAMLKHFINQAVGRLRLVKPDVMVSLPSGATSTERKAVIDATTSAGARAAYIIQDQVAAALGAQIPVTNALGNMIIDVGGGTTEIAVISLGGVVAKASVRVGGDKIDQAIIDYLRRQYGLSIGEKTAEDVKQAVAGALPPDKDHHIDVKGRDIAGGLPRTIKVTAAEVVPIVQEVLEKIMLSIRSVLERTPPELVSDIIDRGILLSGGGAKLHNLDKLLARVVNVPVVVVDDPMNCTIRGIGLALENLADYQKSLLAGS